MTTHAQDLERDEARVLKALATIEWAGVPWIARKARLKVQRTRFVCRGLSLQGRLEPGLKLPTTTIRET